MIVETLILTVVAGATGGALRIGHAVSACGRALRGARRKLAPARKLVKEIGAEHGRRDARLDEAVRSFVGEQTRERLGEIPIEDLRAEGAERVRWNALREGGYRNLADLQGVSTRRLAEVNGVGETTAPRILEAAEQAASRVRESDPLLPDPELTGGGASDVGQRALSVLHLRRSLGESYKEVWQAVDQGERELKEASKEAGFGRWLLRTLRSRSHEESIARLDEWGTRAEAVVDSPACARLEESWKALRKERRLAKGEGLGARVREEYPAICSVVEESFERLGLVSRDRGRRLRGGCPEEIAERVEEFPLACDALDVQLRGYQRFGAKYLLAQERTILGDEMGLGKTIEALAVMTHLWSAGEGKHFFVLAPAGLIWNWQREVQKRAPFPAYVLHGDDIAETHQRWNETGGMAVTSYSTLRLLAQREGLRFEEPIAFLVADEAHYLKNPEAARTQASQAMIEGADRVCLMTGTPLENEPSEFGNLIRAVRPETAAELERTGELREGLRARPGFHQRVAPVYLRRNQEDVLSELPERIEVEEWVDLEHEEERAAYRQAAAERNFMGMRRATVVANGVSSKLDHLEELLEDHRASGRKVLVFSYFLDVLKAIDKRFEVAGVISGATSPEDRIELVEKFNTLPGHAILASQIDSGGTGLNLQSASVVVLTEPQLKPTTEAQAIARAHRMGQTQRVVVHRLYARHSVDERLVQLLAEKSELFESYARESAVKSASAEAVQTKTFEEIVEEERRRLGITDVEATASGALE